MVKRSTHIRVAPNFYKLIVAVKYECVKNGKKPLTSEQITRRIATKLTKEDILYNNYLTF